MPTSISHLASLSIVEDAAPVGLGLSIADDSGSPITVTLTLSNPAAGWLSAGGGPSSTLSFTDTAEALNAILAGIQFTSAPNWNGEFTIDIELPGSQIPNTAIPVAASSVNDVPVVSYPAAIDVTEDVASALTGISFSDVDAGAGSVTATFSVASGGLSATSGGGVTVGGTASALTLTGSMSNLNAFIAGSNVTYITAANANGTVPLTVNINDGGNAGAGGALQATATLDLDIQAVNDAPYIYAPVFIDINGGGWPIAGVIFSDVDASGDVQATFSFSDVVPGALSGAADANVAVSGGGGSLTLTGTLAEINHYIAMGKLTYDAPVGTQGFIHLSVEIDDLGGTGSGGASSLTANILLDVDIANSSPTGTVTISGTATQGQTLTAANTLADANGMGEVSYQWRADGEDIAGATGDSLTLTQAEVGKAISVVASFEDEGGALESVGSVATADVANVNDLPTGGVSISGVAQVGRTLTADTSTLGDLDGLGEFSYEWRVDGEYIGDDSTLTLHQDMLGKSITVSVSYEDGYGEEESVSSAGVTVGAPPAPDPEPTRTVETRTIGDRTFTIETVIGPDGIPRKTITTAPNDTPNGPPATLDLVTPPNHLVLNLPSGFGVTASGPIVPTNLQDFLASASPDIVRMILANQAAIIAQNEAFIQNLQFTAGQFADLANPIGLTGTPDSYSALLLSTIQGITSQLDDFRPNIELNNIDLALIMGRVNLIGGAGRQLVFGDGAQQSMVLGEDDDELHGGGGADTVGSTLGNDSLFGDEGEDSVFGGVGDDQVFGGAEADTVHGNAGNDLVQGNQGDDLVYGGQGDDVVRGGQGDDLAFGDLGNDLVFGDLGNDTLGGGDGNDTLSGGPGDDVLTGGAGADVFRLARGEGTDRVTDFTAADHVVLEAGTVFSLRQEGADTVIDLGEGRMILAGVRFDVLPEGWLAIG